MNNKLTWQNIVSAFFLILSMIMTLIGFNSYINYRIETTIKNPEYLRKIASHVRPAIISDSNGSIINDQGGMQYIEKIDVETRENYHIPKEKQKKQMTVSV